MRVVQPHASQRRTEHASENYQHADSPDVHVFTLGIKLTVFCRYIFSYYEYFLAFAITTNWGLISGVNHILIKIPWHQPGNIWAQFG